MQVGPTFNRRTVLGFAGASACALAIGAPSNASAQAAGKSMTTPTGLQITDTKVGTGATPKAGQTCVMHYTGWLSQNGQKGCPSRSIHSRQYCLMSSGGGSIGGPTRPGVSLSASYHSWFALT